MGLEWLWGALVTAVCGGIAVLISRAARSYADESVKPLWAKVAEMDLDLARHYVRKDDDVMNEIRRDNKKLLRMFTQLQITLAKRLNFAIVRERDDDSDEE